MELKLLGLREAKLYGLLNPIRLTMTTTAPSASVGVSVHSFRLPPNFCLVFSTLQGWR